MAGANFALHFHLLKGRPKPLLKDPEFRMFLGILAAATVLLTVDLGLNGDSGGILNTLRLAAFQSTTIVTTTGFATDNFDAWPAFSRALLFLLMFVGGCAGSTGGSVKVARIMIVLKKLAIDLRRLIRPRAVIPLRIGKKAIPEEIVASVTTFFILFLTLFAAGGLVLALLGMDMVSAFSASAACIGNIGPGFGAVGPVETYAPLPSASKLLMLGLMLVGRLELYTVLVLLFIWRKN
jgi:trk system potassium uptake protein TrkH